MKLVGVRAGLVVAVFGVAFAACTGSEDLGSKPASCVPGASAACSGPGGCPSRQVCLPSGTYGPCDCGAALADGGFVVLPDGAVVPVDGSVAAGAPGTPTGIAAAALPGVGAVTTLAGSSPGFADGPGPAGLFRTPWGIVVDPSGNVFVADDSNWRIRKVSAAGDVTTIAGSGNRGYVDSNKGADAQFWQLRGMGRDSTGNLFIGDGDNLVRRVASATGVTGTLAGSGAPGGLGGYADGAGPAARFNGPHGIAVDAAGTVYVADQSNNRIRKVSPAGVVTTWVGSGAAGSADGTGTNASFTGPAGIAVDGTGTAYVADTGACKIRVVSAAGVVTTLAGSGVATFADGTGASASFNYPWGVAVDSFGNVYVADSSNNRIRRVTPGGEVTTVAGSGAQAWTDGTGTAANFAHPYGIAVGADGTIYVADTANRRIRKITAVGSPGELQVKWTAPASTGGSPITGYTAIATAVGQPTKTCTTTGALACSISGLASGVAYSVSVTATNSAGTSAPSAPVTASPN